MAGLSLLPQETTLADLLLSAYSPAGGAFHAWSDAQEVRDAFLPVLGDDCFQRSGGSYVLEYDLEDLLHMLSTAYGEELSTQAEELLNSFAESLGLTGEETLDFTLTITPSGERDCSFTMDLDLRSAYITLSMDYAYSGGQEDFSLSFQVKNLAEFDMTLDSTVRSTTQEPQAQPPAGSEIIDLNQQVSTVPLT